MHTHARSYLAAPLGSMLGAALLGWFGGWLAEALNSGPGSEGLGGVVAIVLAAYSFGWLGTGLGCALALRLVRAAAIGRTGAWVLLLSPIAAVLHYNVMPTIIDSATGTDYQGPKMFLVTLLLILGILSLVTHWLVVGMYEQRPPSAALVIAGLALLLVVSGLLLRAALPRWTPPAPDTQAAYPALAVAASALPTIQLPSTELITTPPQPYLAPGEMVPTPTATPPPRWADLAGGVTTLPTDRLWALAPLPYGEACDRTGSALLAASPTGDVAWLRSAVFQSLPRGIAPPLVVTCAPGGVYDIADPQTAQTWALPPQAGPEPYSFTLSPDGQQVAWLTPAGYDAGTGGMFGYQGGRLGRELQVLDLATGTLRTFSGAQLPPMRQSTYTTLRGWGVGGIVIDVFTGPDTSGTWQLDPQAAQPVAARLDTPADQFSQINMATGHLVYWNEPEQALVLRDLQTNVEQVLAQAPAGEPLVVPIHADFSPDGQMLVFVRPATMPDGAVQADLVLRDVRTGKEQIIVPALSLPAGARWAFGGQALVLVTSTPIINGATVAHGTIVLDRAGNVVGSVPSEPYLPPYVLQIDGQPLVVGSSPQNTTLVVDPGALAAPSPPTTTQSPAELIYLPTP